MGIKLQLWLRNIGFTSATYCLASFVFTVVIYLCLVLTRNATFINPVTGAPVEAIIPTSTLFVSAFFMGAMIMLLSLGGLLGVWVLTTYSSGNLARHLAGATMLAFLISGAFMLGSSLGEDRLVIRAMSVAVLSIGIVLLVMFYEVRKNGKKI